MAAEQKIPTQEREARVMSGWIDAADHHRPLRRRAVLICARVHRRHGRPAPAAPTPTGALFVGGIVALVVAVLLTPGFFTLQPNEARVLDPLRQLQGHAASRAGSAGATRSTPTGRPGRPAASRSGRRARTRVTATRADRPQEAEALQDQPARPHPQRREAQGERQARQPGGHRRRGRVARGGHRQGRLRRRRLRDVRRHAERDGRAPPGQRLPLRLRRDVRRHRGRDHAARQRGRGLRGAARGARTSGSRRPASRVEQARLTHLAYAPEIAQAMLRRQQAEAVIAARRKIVTGAVSMVEMALTDFSRARHRRSSTTSARPPWSATSWSCSAARARSPRSSTPARCTREAEP